MRGKFSVFCVNQNFNENLNTTSAENFQLHFNKMFRLKLSNFIVIQSLEKIAGALKSLQLKNHWIAVFGWLRNPEIIKSNLIP